MSARESNKMFRAFLSKNNSDIRDGYLRIKASESIVASHASFKKVMVEVYRTAPKTIGGKDKAWQQSIVYQLKKCGFVCERIFGSVDAVYVKEFICNTII